MLERKIVAGRFTSRMKCLLYCESNWIPTATCPHPAAAALAHHHLPSPTGSNVFSWGTALWARRASSLATRPTVSLPSTSPRLLITTTWSSTWITSPFCSNSATQPARTILTICGRSVTITQMSTLSVSASYHQLRLLTSLQGGSLNYDNIHQIRPWFLLERKPISELTSRCWSS